MFRSGQQIGAYTLIENIGRGGFGEVWLAEKRSQFVNKKVAVKLPLDAQINFEAIRQEATLWEQASGHSNVLPIIDADVYDGQVVIVSEYADGGSLSDKLKISKPPIEIAVEMTIGILNGLEFLHSKQIIHRDIKPQNILLQNNTPRLADFGISRAMNTDTISSVVAGTDAYMSPEAFDGIRNVQTDIWSVGVVLYQMLKGDLPYPQQHPTERMFAILTKEFEPLPQDVPKELRSIVEKALARVPAERFQTAEQMSRSLRSVLAQIQNPQIASTEVLENSQIHDLETEAINIQSTNEQGDIATKPKRSAQTNSPSGQPTEVISKPHQSVFTEVKDSFEDRSIETNPVALKQKAFDKDLQESAGHIQQKSGKSKLFIGGVLLFLVFGLGILGTSGGAYYYYYIYLPQIDGENIVGVRPSIEYKIGDISRENIASHVNISFTDSKDNQVLIKRGEIIVKKDDLITPEIFQKVSAIYNYNDLSE